MQADPRVPQERPQEVGENTTALTSFSLVSWESVRLDEQGVPRNPLKVGRLG